MQAKQPPFPQHPLPTSSWASFVWCNTSILSVMLLLFLHAWWFLGLLQPLAHHRLYLFSTLTANVAFLSLCLGSTGFVLLKQLHWAALCDRWRNDAASEQGFNPSASSLPPSHPGEKKLWILCCFHILCFLCFSIGNEFGTVSTQSNGCSLPDHSVYCCRNFQILTRTQWKCSDLFLIRVTPLFISW